jgi:hypothetical protein
VAKRVIKFVRDQLDDSEFPEGQGGTFESSLRDQHFRLTTPSQR